MKEEGTVVSVEGRRARVRIERSARCGGCSLCSALAGGRGMEILLEAPPGVESGSSVVLEVPESSPLKAALLLCLLPILSFLAGVFLAESVVPRGRGGPLLWMLAGLLFMTASFLVIFLRERRAARRGRPRPRIVEVKPPDPSRGNPFPRQRKEKSV